MNELDEAVRVLAVMVWKDCGTHESRPNETVFAPPCLLDPSSAWFICRFATIAVRIYPFVYKVYLY